MHLHFAEAMPCYLQQLGQNVMISETKSGEKHGLITRLMSDYYFMTTGFFLLMLAVPFNAGNVWLLLIEVVLMAMAFGILRGKYAEKKPALIIEFLVLLAMYLFFLLLAVSKEKFGVGEIWELLFIHFIAAIYYGILSIYMRSIKNKEFTLTAEFFILAMIYLFFICIAFIFFSYVYEAALETSASDDMVFLLYTAGYILYLAFIFWAFRYWSISYNEQKNIHTQKGDIHGNR